MTDLRAVQPAPAASRNGSEGPDDSMGLAELRARQLGARLLTRSGLALLPPPVPLVSGLLNRDTLAAVFGKPGSAKSFLALDLGMSVATGTPWCGREVHRGNVLFIAAEGVAGLPRRAAAWERAHRVPVGDGPMLWLPNAVNLLQREWVDGLAMVVDEFEPVFIVVDTLARSMAGGDENGPRDMGTLVESADRLRQVGGATVLLVHHTPKDGLTLRGHSSLEGAVDTAIEVRSDDRGVTVTSAKQKDMADFEDVRLVLRQVGESCALGLRDHCHDSETLHDSERVLLDHVTATTGSDGLAATVLLRTSEMPERTFYRAMKALVRRGLVVNVGTANRPRYAVAPERNP